MVIKSVIRGFLVSDFNKVKVGGWGSKSDFKAFGRLLCSLPKAKRICGFLFSGSLNKEHKLYLPPSVGGDNFAALYFNQLLIGPRVHDDDCGRGRGNQTNMPSPPFYLFAHPAAGPRKLVSSGCHNNK
jgi:hypothetical protein